MKCFEVSINDVPVCRAGIGEFGVLAAVLSWVRRHEDQKPEDLSDELWTAEELTFDVSGRAKNDPEMKERRKWISQEVSVGDRIQIEIVEAEECDEPEVEAG